jgi:uncharacterized SAM-binding protein YcdF (DUF218 family)
VKSNRVLRLVKVSVVVLLAWVLIAWCWARWLSVAKPLDRADVIVVLSGSKAFRERTEFAATLYRNGVAPRILLTNDGERASWSNVEERNPPYQELAARELEQRGVPASAITLVDLPVQGTLDEAVTIRKYADDNGIRSILIVTSEYHSRRALWTFERVFAGREANIGLQSPKMTNAFAVTWWIYPQGWKTVGAEFVKMVYYRMTVTAETQRNSIW